MANVVRTTVYLERDDYERIKDIASVQRRAPAELVREAVSEYAARNRATRRPKSIGIGHSGKGNVSERAESLLEGMGKS